MLSWVQLALLGECGCSGIMLCRSRMRSVRCSHMNMRDGGCADRAHALYPDWSKHTMLRARQVGQLGGMLLRLPQGGKDKEPKMFYYILM